MRDDELPASELRKRMGRGGTLADSELSSSQLRSRYGIPANKWEEMEKKETSGGVPLPIVILAGLLVSAAIAWWAHNRSNSPI